MRSGAFGLAVLLLMAAMPAHAQQTRSAAPGASPPAASIDDLAWLAGSWRGEGLGAPATEVYSAPQAGQIAGHFLQEDGKGGVLFYELIHYVPRDGSVVMRLRHFGPDLRGWEDATGEAEEFVLVAVEGNRFYFDGLTLDREGPDALTIWVRIKGRDGASRDIAFRYRREGR